jgi:hypothetical protein
MPRVDPIAIPIAFVIRVHECPQKRQSYDLSNMANGFWRVVRGNVTGWPTRCDSNTATIISVAERA